MLKPDMNSTSNFQDEVTAIHEAAHGVAFQLQGLAAHIADVHIVGTGLTLGSLQLKPRVRFPLGTQESADLALIERICIAFLVAKPTEMKWLRQEQPASEEEMFGRYRWTSGVTDIEDAAEVAAQRFASDTVEELGAYLTYIWARAKAFVADPEHWYIIQRVAAALIQMKRIDSGLLDRLIDSARNEYRASGIVVKPAPISLMAQTNDFSVFVRELLPHLDA
ncbi:MAG: hypothetical protein J0H49_28985 [Acidobacteria bacterium]|nr:hypothetical protein [Acidobacteriota bacterium]